MKNLLNQYDESKAFAPIAGTYIKEMYAYIASYERLGTYTDAAEQKVDLLIVHLKTSSLERARTTQRNFVATYLKDRGEKGCGPGGVCVAGSGGLAILVDYNGVSL